MRNHPPGVLSPQLPGLAAWEHVTEGFTRAPAPSLPRKRRTQSQT